MGSMMGTPVAVDENKCPFSVGERILAYISQDFSIHEAEVLDVVDDLDNGKWRCRVRFPGAPDSFRLWIFNEDGAMKLNDDSLLIKRAHNNTSAARLIQLPAANEESARREKEYFAMTGMNGTESEKSRAQLIKYIGHYMRIIMSEKDKQIDNTLEAVIDKTLMDHFFAQPWAKEIGETCARYFG